MANRNSLMWRAPGRRSAEREKFRRLIKKVEAVRVREGMTKTKLSADPLDREQLPHSVIRARRGR